MVSWSIVALFMFMILEPPNFVQTKLKFNVLQGSKVRSHGDADCHLLDFLIRFWSKGSAWFCNGAAEILVYIYLQLRVSSMSTTGASLASLLTRQFLMLSL